MKVGVSVDADKEDIKKKQSVLWFVSSLPHIANIRFMLCPDPAAKCR